MHITDEIIEHISDLAKLELTPQEKQQQKRDMQSIVNYVEIMNLLDTGKIEISNSTHSINNVFRQDTIKKSYERDEMLKNATEQKSGYYTVPKTLE